VYNVRNTKIWINGVHGEILHEGEWKKFQVSCNNVTVRDGILPDDIKDWLVNKVENFWSTRRNVDEI